MNEIKLFINGEFKKSSTSNTYMTADPSNGEQIAKVHLPTNEDINNAIRSARDAFNSKEWKLFDQKKRSDLLLRISELILERKKELIANEIKDSGSTYRKASADIYNTASFFKVMSKVSRNFNFSKIDENSSRKGFSKNTRIYEPVGVCAQIIPWNFPLLMAAWKIGPVLATGCTTILKSAEETPITASLLAQIIKDAGVPNGVINIITGGAKEGEALISHRDINKVSFTGSTDVGKIILEKISSSIKNSTMELGGKSANIILDDADLDIAVDSALYAFLYHSGQACDSGTRLLIQKGIYKEFKKRFLKRIKDITPGLTSEKNTCLGPVISEKQLRTIINYIDITKKEGAKLLYGGKRLNKEHFSKGYYILPTVFEITPDNTIWHEEIFGPVVGMTKFETIDEAISLANNSLYGLAGAVWSKNIENAKKIALNLQAGTVWINEYHLLNPGMPFGGYKQSGLGREMGEEGILSYLEVKHLWESECSTREGKSPWLDAIF